MRGKWIILSKGTGTSQLLFQLLHFNADALQHPILILFITPVFHVVIFELNWSDRLGSIAIPRGHINIGLIHPRQQRIKYC
jgi:hypothetical protein